MSKRARIVMLTAWAVLLGTGCWTLHSRHRQFAFYRHPDEPGKVEQIAKRNWNFHHPMLLLGATDAVITLCGIAKEEQGIVETGRAVSAVFTACAVVALSLLGYLWRGWLVALTVGAVLTLHHQLYELSHYMKEDSALLMGVAFTLLAAKWFSLRPSSWRAILLGAACALAISGKYLGVVVLAIALPVLWHANDARRARRIALFCIVLIGVFAAVNLPLLRNTTALRNSVGREMDSVARGQRGMTRAVPHAQYWNVFLDNTTPVIWLLLLFSLLARWRERRALSTADWATLMFPFAFALALSFSPKSNDRYFLPATAVFTFLSVVALEDASALAGRRFSRDAIKALLVIVLIVLQVTGWSSSRPGFRKYDLAFQHDDIEELASWIRAELPENALLATDNRVGLPNARKKKYRSRGEPLAQPILSERYVADLGSVEELRARAVTHVIVSESDYGRFFLKSLKPQKEEEASFQRRQAFYTQLFREGKRLWARPRGTVIYLHPGIEVFEI